MKIVLNDKTEFRVDSLQENRQGVLDIYFGSEISYESVKNVYDPHDNPDFSEDVLNRFEVYNEEGILQGVHMGYTQPTSITSFNGVLKVVIKQETPHETLTKAIDKTTQTSSMDELVSLDILLMVSEQLQEIANILSE